MSRGTGVAVLINIGLHLADDALRTEWMNYRLKCKSDNAIISGPIVWEA